ncbi:MAG: PstS family phosphate ABC transporter substrate-binding protein [Planctomycetota bacterium]
MRLSFLFPVSLLVLATSFGCESKPSTNAKPANSSGALASDESYEVNEELQGEVKIDGSSTVFPISEAASAEFSKRFPNVSVTVGSSGTGGGFKKFNKGETDISDASRPVKAEEFASALKNNVKMIEVPVAYDGLTIVVHPDNDFLKEITVDQLKKIFNGDSPAQKWSDVDGAWPDREIKRYAPGTDSGTFDYFKEIVAGKTGSITDQLSASESDNVLVTGVAGSVDAIGFFGVAYYEENKDKLRAVPVINPKGEAVLPSMDAIKSGSYAPFSRPLFIYVNADSMKRPEVRMFVEFYLDNAPELAAANAYPPLPMEVYELARKNAQELTTGTHFLEEKEGKMEKREGPIAEVFVSENRYEG